MASTWKGLLLLSTIHFFSLSHCKSHFKISRMPKVPRRRNYGGIHKVHDNLCYDVDKERCNNYDMYCATRTEFMSENCKVTCKMCIPGDPLMDLSSKCASELKKNGQDLCNKVEWSSVCPHSCDEHICADKEPENCKPWASIGGCISKHTYMTENCRLSCGMCTPGDPLMDTTSECKSKESQCRDVEWQEICPHTCRGYATASSVLQPQQPVRVAQSQLPPPANLGQQQPGGVQPQATVTGVPLQQQQQPGVAQSVGSQQPSTIGKPLQAQQSVVAAMPIQAQQPAVAAMPAQAQQPAPVAMPAQAQQPGVVGQPVQLQQAGQVPQPVQPQQSAVVGQPVQLQQAGQVPQPVQPQQPAVVGQPAQAQHPGEVASPIQTQQLRVVNQPVQPQPQPVQPQPQPVQPQPQPVQPPLQSVIPTQPQAQVVPNPAGQVLQTQQLPTQTQVNQPTQFQPTVVQGQPYMPQGPVQPVNLVQPQPPYQPLVYNPGIGTVGPMKKQKGEKVPNRKPPKSNEKKKNAKTVNKTPETTKKKETRKLGFRKVKEPGKGNNTKSGTDEQVLKQVNHEKDEKETTLEEDTRSRVLQRMEDWLRR